MTDKAQEAKTAAQKAGEQAKQVASQAKAAGKSTVRMTQKGTGAVAEVAADELHDAAQDAVGAVRSLPTSSVTKGVIALGAVLGAGAFVLIKRHLDAPDQTSVVVSD